MIAVAHIAGTIEGPVKGGWFSHQKESDPLGFYGTLGLWTAFILGLWVLQRRTAKKREKMPHYPWGKKPIQPPVPTRGNGT